MLDKQFVGLNIWYPMADLMDDNKRYDRDSYRDSHGGQ